MPDKLKELLTSRRFWALMTALVATAAAYSQGQITPWEAVIAVTASTSVFAIATGLEHTGQSADAIAAELARVREANPRPRPS